MRVEENSLIWLRTTSMPRSSEALSCDGKKGRGCQRLPAQVWREQSACKTICDKF